MLCYSITELFAEKLRALAERCRPRDLYDVVHMHRHPDLIGRQRAVAAALARKCAHAGIGVPDPRHDPVVPVPRRRSRANGRTCSATSSRSRSRPSRTSGPRWTTCSAGWPAPSGRRTCPGPQLGDLDPPGRSRRPSPHGGAAFPLELLRYAGANRLKVDIDYRAENGRQGPRRVEPYSLRRTKDGNLVLFVVNDRGQLRSYRVDRIAGIKPTTESVHPHIPSGILIRRTLPAASCRKPGRKRDVAE